MQKVDADILLLLNSIKPLPNDGAALSDAGIRCNVKTAFYHDQIFVSVKDKLKAREILTRLSQ